MATKRPRLVAALACWLMLAGLISPLFLLESGDESMADYLANDSGMGIWQPIAQHLGPSGIALFGVAYMLMLGAIGYGLWSLKEWARRTTIGLAVLSLLWTFWPMAHDSPRGKFLNGGNLVVLIFVALVVYYFERPSVKRSFRQPQTD